jgi:hypothetical protein
MDFKEGKIKFQAKARIISILGEQLIKDSSIGIIELVKNSYDADASKININLKSLNTEWGVVEIQDNGLGMDLETLLSKWMTPASGHKEIQKLNNIRTKKGRLPLGEKGVGRFAAQKIGNKFRMITKVKNTNKELCVFIDWRDFVNNDKYLTDIEIEYKERQCEVFRENESGTLLRIFDLKENFSEFDIKKISTTLRRLKSPFKGVKDLDLQLNFENCDPQFNKYSNLELTDIVEKAHYKLSGIVDENGILEYNYEFKLPGFDKRCESEKFDLSQFSNIKTLRRPYVCGSFFINLYNYDRSPDIILKSNINTKDLDEVCGVSVYRDGIRIFPYGEKGDDWLGLDKRRIQEPTKRIDNNTIIGLVEINQLNNKYLIDKTNREGLIENTAFEYFENLVLSCVMFLEELKSRDKPIKTKVKGKKIDVKQEIREGICSIKDTLSSVVESLNKKKDEESLKSIETLENTVAKIERDITGKLEEDEESRKILLSLAGTGLAAERFTHEFELLINGVLDSLKKLTTLIDINSDGKIKKEFVNIQTAMDALRNDIRLLGPMFYFKKSTKEKNLSIHHIIQTVINLQNNSLKKLNIETEITGNNFTVIMREGLCAQIFNNLLDNSVYWLSHKTEKDKRKVKFILDDKNKCVYVSDNGPGIIDKFKDKIFDLFFTMKGEEGRGLGLWIIKEILNDKKGDILSVSKDEHNGLLSGASFKIKFLEA